jgi:hypothetical protein
MTESKEDASLTQSPEAPASTHSERVNVGAAEVEKDLLLATYVDQLAPTNYTEEAKATLLFEVKQYAQDIVSLTRMRRRADRNAEKVLRSHVTDSASFLRNKKDDLVDKLADWSKWIGFTFIGFAVAQWIHIRSEKPVASGSLTWFAVDVIIAAIMMVIGLALNKPWGYFTDLFRAFEVNRDAVTA